MRIDEMDYRNSGDAFDDAIKAGALNTNQSHPHYAGNYMYMHSCRGTDYFKNTMTREYDVTNTIK